MGRVEDQSIDRRRSGHGPVHARRLFTYTPKFKLVVIGNHQPALDNPDDATKRRFNIVPFVHKPETPDRQLETKLRTEWPGILRWLIDGCLSWQCGGMVRPQVVTDATAKYFSEQDRVAQWIEEFCELGGRAFNAPSSQIFSSWSCYAHSVGEKPNTSKWLTDALRRHRCEVGKVKGVRSIEGIRFKPGQAAGGSGQ
jgi:putative DNA primase/helicase